MKLFLDANILIAVINKEFPLFDYCARILGIPENNKQYELFTSPISLAICYYFAEKKVGKQRANEKISILIKHLSVASVGFEEVSKAGNQKNIIDFEDGLQYFSAINAGCDIIITENGADFYFSKIPVYDAKTYLLYHFKG